MDYTLTIRSGKRVLCPAVNDLSKSEARKWVRVYAPDANHRALAWKYYEASKCAKRAYWEAVDMAFLLTFGHKSLPNMCQVSGIWRNEFTDHQKDVIRYWLNKEAQLLRIATMYNDCLKKADKVF